MSSIPLIKALQSENSELVLQLKDLEYLIQMKEEELEELKKMAASMARLQSKLDENLYEFEHMQLIIGKQQQQADGAKRREDALENEIIQSIETEKAYYELREEYQHMLNLMEKLNADVSETPSLVKEVADLQAKLTEAESSLELLTLDNYYLLEELKEFRKRRIISNDQEIT
jgi:hypothetical protein